MTKRWKLKTNSSNILLVLITLILITAEWTSGHLQELNNSTENNEIQTYVGNDEISRFFFSSSAANSSRVLEDVNRCLDNFQLVTCLKMLLLDRINGLLGLLEDPSAVQKDFHLVRNLVVFERKNLSENPVFGEKSESLNLDEEISVKVLRMFWNRCLRFNLLPNVKIEIEPTAAKTKDCFVCFSYKIQKEVKSSSDDNDKMEQGRKKGKKGKGRMSMMMMLPQLLMLGFMPFTLASLKAMVMNAVMINMMALNGAIFMTIRNLVFGPRSGDNVKYVNYGYSKDRQTQSRRPVLIIHSPAAFVKQPKVYKDRGLPTKTYQGDGYYPQTDLGPGHIPHGDRHFDQFLTQGNELYFHGYGHENRKSLPRLGIEFSDTGQSPQRHYQHPHHKPNQYNRHSPHHHLQPDIEIEHRHGDATQPHQHKHKQLHQQQVQQRQQQMTQIGYSSKNNPKNNTYQNNTLYNSIPLFQYPQNHKTSWFLPQAQKPTPRQKVTKTMSSHEDWRMPYDKSNAKHISKGDPTGKKYIPVESNDKNPRYPP